MERTHYILPHTASNQDRTGAVNTASKQASNGEVILYRTEGQAELCYSYVRRSFD
jgi:hypothetical protein